MATNDSLATATVLSFNTPVTQALTASQSLDYFQITVPAGKLSVNFKHADTGSDRDGWSISVLDGAGIQHLRFPSLGTTTDATFSVDLPAGTYYIKVADGSNFGSSFDKEYQLTVTANAGTNYEIEANDTIATANSIDLATAYSGILQSKSPLDADYYKVTVPTGKLSVNFKHADTGSDRDGWSISVLDDADIQHLRFLSLGTTTDATFSVDLPAGTYYIKIADGSNFGSSFDKEYQLTVTANAGTRYEIEANDTIATANPIDLATTYSGILQSKSPLDTDYYKVAVPTGKLSVNFKHADTGSDRDGWSISVLDGAGIQHLRFLSLGTTTDATFSVDLPAGTYYIKIADNSNFGSSFDKEYQLTVTASAGTNYEIEANDTIATANPIALATTFAGILQSKSPLDVDYYAVTVPAGKLSVNFKHANTGSDSDRWAISVLDAAGTQYLSFNSPGTTTDATFDVDLPTGTYYVKIADNSNFGSSFDKEYQLTVTASAGNNFEIEINDAIVAATPVALATTYGGFLQSKSPADADYFKVTVPAGKLSVNFKHAATGSASDRWAISVLDGAGYQHLSFSSPGTTTDTTFAVALPAGTYYVKIADNSNFGSSFDKEYQLTVTSSTGNYEVEANDTMATANAIAMATTYAGILQSKSPADVDYFKVEIPAGRLAVNFKHANTGATSDIWSLAVLDGGGTQYLNASSPGTTIDDTFSLDLPGGTYYVKVADNSSFGSSFDKEYQLTATARANQTISFGALPSLAYGGSATLSATATSGLAVAFSSTTPGVCSVSGSTVTAIATGTCTVAANQSGNANYLAAPQTTQSVTVTAANQTISFGALPNLAYGGTATLSATATSGLVVAFGSTTPGVCSVSGSTLTAIATGTCTVAANQSGNANYLAAPQATQSITVTAAHQTISFSALANLAYGGTATLNATATSGLAVAFSSATPSVCSVSGSTVTAVATGSCTVSADQSGNANYLAAPQATQSLSIVQASQTISFGARPSLAYGGTATLSATATSGLVVAFSSTTASVCSVSGSTVTALATGTCTVAANQSGNANYLAASQATQSITVTAANQAISFGAQPSLAYGGNATLSATATSGLAVAFSSTTPGVCSVSGSTVAAIATGTCTVAANQSGNANYLAAPQATQSITVAAANQTISFGTVANLAYGSAATLNATATSGLTVAFSSTTPGVCSVSGSTVTAIATGTCTVAADQSGNANYLAAPQATQSIAVGAANQTITFGAPPSLAFGGTATVAATATSGLAVTFSSTTTGVCSVSGNTVTALTTGTCTVAADQSGNANYLAATRVTQNITVAAASQTISFGAAPSLTYGGTATVAATATSGLTVAFSSSTPNVCSVSGSTVTAITTGTCTIAANQGGNTHYLAAAQVTQSFAVSARVPGAPTIGTATPGNASATVSFSAPTDTGGAAITRYSVTSNPGNVTATASASPIRVPGLTNGTAYTFTVTATNAAGTGPASAASNSATPSATTWPLTVATSGTGYGSITSTPPGIDCGNACTANFTGGSSITLLATPASGSSFAGWSGACTGTGTCTVSLDSAKSVTAAFNPTGVVYVGTVTNTTINGQATLTVSLIVDSQTNAVSGSLNVSNLPGSSQTLCGAGTISGTRSGTTLAFTYTSHDTRAGCGANVDWGNVFTYNATVQNTVPPTISGTFSGMGQVGQYTLSCTTAPNCLSAAANGTSTTTTTVSSTTTTTLPAANIGIVAGWNLIGNGVEAPVAVADTFGDATKVETVWKWVVSGSTPGVTYPAWAFYTPTQPDRGQAYAATKGYDFLTTINPGEGFWLNAKTAFSVSLPAATALRSSSFMPALTNPPTPGGLHALPRGWSLIATGDGPTPAQFNEAIATSVATLPSDGKINTNLVTLWAWNATEKAWFFWAPSLVNSNGLASYLTSKGYLDFASLPTTPSGTLAPTRGVWVNMP